MDARLALPDDVEALKSALAPTCAELVAERARTSSHQALVAAMKLAIEKLRRELYGQRSEQSARLLDQMKLQLEELEAAATEDELAAEPATTTTPVTAFVRRRPSRRPFPEHLPREWVGEAAPSSCACCGGTRLAMLGEDLTETLEVIPRQWKVIQHVREKFTCRGCKAISQPPNAPRSLTLVYERTGRGGASG